MAHSHHHQPRSHGFTSSTTLPTFIGLSLIVTFLTIFTHVHGGVTNYASWVLTSPSGTPPNAMCDHVTVNMNDRLFVMYGGDDSEFFFANGHTINVLDARDEDAPAWSTLNLTTSVRPPYRSASTATANSRNGHVVMFGGYQLTYPVYLDDLWILAIDVASLSNTDSSTWRGSWHALRTLSSDGGSNGGPVARGWTDMVWADPVTQTTLILYGGLGSDTSNLGTILDADQYDTWLLNATLLDAVVDGVYASMPQLTFNTRAAEWSVIENPTCLTYTTKCTDSKLVSARFPLLSDYAANLTELLATTGRSSDMIDLLTQIKDLANTMASSAQNDATAWPTNPANTGGNCSTICSAKATLTSQPRASEGHRGVTIGSIYFQFGGYACTTYGEFITGGPACYDSSVYFLDIDSQQWFQLTKPGDGSEQDQLWATARAYHTMVEYNGRLWIFGGGYKDQTSIYSYYNDVYVFNIYTLMWEAVKLSGAVPEARWSHTATMVGNTMWVFGGCSSAVQYYNDVYQLRLGSRISAANCSATGAGLSMGQAGEPSSFQIQTRRPGYYDHNGTYHWGDAIVWGTDLTFDVRLVATSSTGAAAPCTFTFTEVTEIGEGIYNVSFIPEAGETQSLSVFLNNEHIPGSPFTFTLSPSIAQAERSTASGIGIISTVKGDLASFMVTLADQYGNQQITGGDGASLMAYSNNLIVLTEVMDYTNGSYLLTYRVPESDSFTIVVQYDFGDIAGSPFTVRGYNQLAVGTGVKWTMVVLTTIAITLCLMGIIFIIWQRTNKVIRASSPLFMVLILIGACIGLSSVYALVEVNDSSCQAFQWLLGLGFTIMLACVYAKTWRISTIFTSTLLKKRRDIKDAHLLARCAILIGFELLWNSLWSGISPLHPHQAFSSTNPVLSVTSCTCDNSAVWYGVSVGSKALLVLAGVFLATMTKDVPAAFNESKLLAIAIYNAAFCSLIGLPIMFFVTNNAADNISSLFTLKAMLVLWEIFATAAILMYPRVYYVIKPPPAGFFDTHQRPGSGMLHANTQGGFSPNPHGSPAWKSQTMMAGASGLGGVSTINVNKAGGNLAHHPSSHGDRTPILTGTAGPNANANQRGASPGLTSPHNVAMHRLNGTSSQSGRNGPMFADVRAQLGPGGTSPMNHSHTIGAPNGTSKNNSLADKEDILAPATAGTKTQAWTAPQPRTVTPGASGPTSPSITAKPSATASVAPAPQPTGATNRPPSGAANPRRTSSQPLLGAAKDSSSNACNNTTVTTTSAASPAVGTRALANPSPPLSYIPTSVMGSPSSVYHTMTAEPSAASQRDRPAQQLQHLADEIEKRREEMEGANANNNENSPDGSAMPMRARVDSVVMAGPMFSGHRTSMVGIHDPPQSSPKFGPLGVRLEESPAIRTHTIRSHTSGHNGSNGTIDIASVRGISYALDASSNNATMNGTNGAPLSVVSEGTDIGGSFAGDNSNNLHFPTSAATPQAAAITRTLGGANMGNGIGQGGNGSMSLPQALADRPAFLHTVAQPPPADESALSLVSVRQSPTDIQV